MWRLKAPHNGWIPISFNKAGKSFVILFLFFHQIDRAKLSPESAYFIYAYNSSSFNTVSEPLLVFKNRKEKKKDWKNNSRLFLFPFSIWRGKKDIYGKGRLFICLFVFVCDWVSVGCVCLELAGSPLSVLADMSMI